MCHKRDLSISFWNWTWDKKNYSWVWFQLNFVIESTLTVVLKLTCCNWHVSKQRFISIIAKYIALLPFHIKKHTIQGERLTGAPWASGFGRLNNELCETRSDNWSWDSKFLLWSSPSIGTMWNFGHPWVVTKSEGFATSKQHRFELFRTVAFLVNLCANSSDLTASANRLYIYW